MAVPMLAGTFAINMYNLTNAWFITRLGTEALAAISFTFPIVMLLMFVTRGLGNGAMTLVAHAFWRVVDGIMEGLTGKRIVRGPTAPPPSVQMARDPVCGTYVVPDRAVVLSDGSRQLFFCSTGCRDRYRARPMV